MGRFPGPVGLPGIRWFDRDRARCSFPDYSRSYVGPQVNRLDGDLDPAVPPIFDLCQPSLAAMTPLARGLPRANRVAGLTARTALRAARIHFLGNVAGWLD